MIALRLDRLLEFLTSIELLMALLWLGLAIFTVSLAILMYTRWGQYKPLRKCMGMSVLAHLLIAGYAATVEIIAPIVTPAETVIQISLGDGPDPQAPPGGSGPISAKATEQPWEVSAGDAATGPKAPEREKSHRPAEPQRPAQAETKPPASKTTAPAEAAKPSAADSIAAAAKTPAAPRRDAPAALLEQIEPLPGMTETDVPEPLAPAAEPANPMRLRAVGRVVSNTGAGVASGSGDVAAGQAEKSPGDGAGKAGGAELLASNAARSGNAAAGRSVPDAYRLRVAPNRDGVAQSHGGTSQTEAAVKAALRWLADNQAADGRWNPRNNDAGKEVSVMGRNRQGAGSRADTAMTGLALLAFLGSGHTHLDGPYRHDVRRGLEFLLQTQAADGNLGGQAAVFEFMYCHAMAACAISEAYGLTRDQRLREPVRRAVGYTVAAQDPRGGGWRYRPGDAGDTSQLGWQLMALKSAELAGIPMPEQTRQGIIRYLQSASSGRYGGRASYRPGEQVTRPMTAEALVCWQFLGLAREHPACNEAGDYLLGELPGDGVYNLYYWYYATLGMYQLQGAHWQQWNNALRTTLVERQIKDGPAAGSWDTNDLWGGHGGRVYTTALATLTLEVYYRFLPLYGGVPASVDRAK